MRRTAINNQWWKIPLHLTYALTSRVVGKPQMILQPVSSIFLSTALWDLANSRPVHSLMLPSHLFLCPPCLLPPFTVPCKMLLARSDEQETCPYHCSMHLFMMIRSLCGPIVSRQQWLVVLFLNPSLLTYRPTRVNCQGEFSCGEGDTWVKPGV